MDARMRVCVQLRQYSACARAAGRTYNNLTQYYIFPWVLTDYESAEIGSCGVGACVHMNSCANILVLAVLNCISCRPV